MTIETRIRGNSNASGSGSGTGTGLAISVVQNNHGLAVQDAVRFNGTSYVKAIATDEVNAEVYGLVSAVADTNNFTLLVGGLATGFSSLLAGSAYYLSRTVSGQLTTVEPTNVGDVSKPIFLTNSTSSGYFFNYRGYIIGSTGGSAGGSIVYAPTGGNYLAFAADANLTNERVLTASDNIVITTSTTLMWISATTGAGGGSSLVPPLIVTSGGTGLLTAGSGTMLVGMNSSGVVYDYFALMASDNATIVRNGTGYFISAITNAAGAATNTASLVQSSRTISTIYPISGGGDLSVNRTHAIDTAFLVNTGRSISTIYPVSGGGNFSLDRTFAIDTAFLVNSGRSISTIYPISGGGDLSLSRTFAIDTAFLVTSARSITIMTGLTGGGNLGIDRTIGISTANATVGQYMIVSGGTALGGIAWINTASAAGGSTNPGGTPPQLQYAQNSTTFGGMSGVTWDTANLAMIFSDSTSINMSAVNVSTTSEGLILPQANNSANCTAQGQVVWDTGKSELNIGNGLMPWQVNPPIGGTMIGFQQPSFFSIFSGAIGAGTTDVYTVPSNRRALMYAYTFFNVTTTTLLVGPYIKSGANYYAFQDSSSISAAGNTNQVAANIILDPGESLSVKSSSAGCNVMFKMAEFNSATNLRTVKLLTVNSGFNTFYTAPSNKSSYLLDSTFSQNASINTTRVIFDGGGIRKINFYYVPSGKTASDIYMITTAFNCASQTVRNYQIPAIINSSDSLQFFCDSQGGVNSSLVFANVFEY